MPREEKTQDPFLLSSGTGIPFILTENLRTAIWDQSLALSYQQPLDQTVRTANGQDPISAPSVRVSAVLRKVNTGADANSRSPLRKDAGRSDLTLTLPIGALRSGRLETERVSLLPLPGGKASILKS